MEKPDARNADLAALKIDRGRKSRVPGRGRKWRHLLWLLVPVVLYLGYRFGIEKVRPALQVRTATVRMMSNSEAAAELVATGYVVAQVKAAVASKATGRLRVLNVEEGDSIRSGAVLAELENDDIRADLDLAEANLIRAQADSVAAARNFSRQEDLHKNRLISEQDFEVATAIFAKAVAEVRAMRAVVQAARVALENTIIRAPFNGTVLTKHADVGEMVAPFASASSSKGAVVTMADMSTLEVEADVSESNIQKVIVGAPCEIVLDAYPSHIYDGYVKKIVPTADRARATVLTKIAFSDIDRRVLPEMSARVNFLAAADEVAADTAETAMVIPNTGLTVRNDRQVVFVIVDQVVRETPVETGRTLGDITEIRSGLRVGDIVVLSPPGGLASGDKIEISN